VWESDIGVFPVSWASQGDEWVLHLSKTLVGRERIRLEGSYSEKVMSVGPADETLPSTLRVRPDPAGIRCTVVGDGDEPSEDQTQRWREAAATAAAGLGRHDRDYGWQAVLGPNPRRPDLHVPPLAGPARLGPVLLDPGGVQMREWVSSGPAEISEHEPSYSWPVIASGTVRAYDYNAADILAKFAVHRTCALLTLFCGPHWLPRIGPQVFDQRWGVPPLRVPQSVGERGQAEPDNKPLADFNTNDGDEPLWLPEWTADAWDALDTDRILATAVSAYYEATSMETDHPSAAFLAYVAAIEGIGSKLADLDRCETCKSQKGAGRRFRKALRTVMTANEAGKLAHAYDRRSATAHDGTLFGTEQTLGYPRISAFEYDSRFMFDILMVGQIRRASLRVVTKALSDAAARRPG